MLSLSLPTFPPDRTDREPSTSTYQNLREDACMLFFTADRSEDELIQTWRLLAKTKDSLAHGSRLENASWRRWYQQRNNLQRIPATAVLTTSPTRDGPQPLTSAAIFRSPTRLPGTSKLAELARLDAQIDSDDSTETLSDRSSMDELVPPRKRVTFNEALNRTTYVSYEDFSDIFFLPKRRLYDTSSSERKMLERKRAEHARQAEEQEPEENEARDGQGEEEVAPPPHREDGEPQKTVSAPQDAIDSITAEPEPDVALAVTAHRLLLMFYEYKAHGWLGWLLMCLVWPLAIVLQVVLDSYLFVKWSSAMQWYGSMRFQRLPAEAGL